MATLPTVGADTDNWGNELNTYLQVGHDSAGRHLTRVNVAEYGIPGDGSDVTSALSTLIANIVSGGGRVALYFSPTASGYGISAPLPDLTAGDIVLMSDGPEVSYLKPLGSFSGSQIIKIAADFCGVRDLSIRGGPNNTSASNPSMTAGILISAARQWLISNVEFAYVNGYTIKGAASASINLAGGKVHNYHTTHCAKGMYFLGDAGSNNVGQLMLTNIHPEQVDNGDALLIEDLNDVQITNINGAVAGGAVAGSMVRIRGACSSTILTNVDLGMLAQGTSSPTVLIESNANGSPTNVNFTAGVIQAGNNAVQITSGGEIKFHGIAFKKSNSHGVDISGSTGDISFNGCTWQTGGQSGAASTYDLNMSISSNWVYANACEFLTPVGSGAGTVANVVNDTNHRLYINHSPFRGSGTTPSLVFAGTPQIVRSCPGYSPRGSISAPTITFGSAINTSQHDVSIIFQTIGGMTGFRIGGTLIGSVPTVGVPYRVPARQTVQCDGSGTVPTWIWLAE